MLTLKQINNAGNKGMTTMASRCEEIIKKACPDINKVYWKKMEAKTQLNTGATEVVLENYNLEFSCTEPEINGGIVWKSNDRRSKFEFWLNVVPKSENGEEMERFKRDRFSCSGKTESNFLNEAVKENRFFTAMEKKLTSFFGVDKGGEKEEADLIQVMFEDHLENCGVKYCVRTDKDRLNITAYKEFEIDWKNYKIALEKRSWEKCFCFEIRDLSGGSYTNSSLLTIKRVDEKNITEAIPSICDFVKEYDSIVRVEANDCDPVSRLMMDGFDFDSSTLKLEQDMQNYEWRARLNSGEEIAVEQNLAYSGLRGPQSFQPYFSLKLGYMHSHHSQVLCTIRKEKLYGFVKKEMQFKLENLVYALYESYRKSKEEFLAEIDKNFISPIPRPVNEESLSSGS